MCFVSVFSLFYFLFVKDDHNYNDNYNLQLYYRLLLYYRTDGQCIFLSYLVHADKFAFGIVGLNKNSLGCSLSGKMQDP